MYLKQFNYFLINIAHNIISEFTPAHIGSIENIQINMADTVSIKQVTLNQTRDAIEALKHKRVKTVSV